MAEQPKSHDGRRRPEAHRAAMPAFSPDFLAEVRALEDVDAFVALMEERGIWLNRAAAEGVFLYLTTIGQDELSDGDLDGVTGGRGNGAPPSDEVLGDALRHLAAQLSAF